MKYAISRMVIWVALLYFAHVGLWLVADYFSGKNDQELGTPIWLSTSDYAARFILEAIVFSIIGVVSALCIRGTPQAGLFALSIGVAFVFVLNWDSQLWYYLTNHPTRVNYFFVSAPTLSPVIFPTAAALLWRVWAARRSNDAL